MSSQFLSFLPERVDEIVDDAAWAAGEAWLRRRFPDAREVRCERADGLQLVAAGSNFDSVSCPRCGADLMESWGDVSVQVGGARGGRLPRGLGLRVASRRSSSLTESSSCAHWRALRLGRFRSRGSGFTSALGFLTYDKYAPDHSLTGALRTSRGPSPAGALKAP
jgi:hypothetical protein